VTALIAIFLSHGSQVLGGGAINQVLRAKQCGKAVSSTTSSQSFLKPPLKPIQPSTHTFILHRGMSAKFIFQPNQHIFTHFSLIDSPLKFIVWIDVCILITNIFSRNLLLLYKPNKTVEVDFLQSLFVFLRNKELVNYILSADYFPLP